MSGFRGTDTALEREIRVLEQLAQLRLRRAARELRDTERDLRALKVERAKRRAATAELTGEQATASA